MRGIEQVRPLTCGLPGCRAKAGWCALRARTFWRMYMQEQSNTENMRPQLAKLPPMRGDSRRSVWRLAGVGSTGLVQAGTQARTHARTHARMKPCTHAHAEFLAQVSAHVCVRTHRRPTIWWTAPPRRFSQHCQAMLGIEREVVSHEPDRRNELRVGSDATNFTPPMIPDEPASGPKRLACWELGGPAWSRGPGGPFQGPAFHGEAPPCHRDSDHADPPSEGTPAVAPGHLTRARGRLSRSPGPGALEPAPPARRPAGWQCAAIGQRRARSLSNAAFRLRERVRVRVSVVGSGGQLCFALRPTAQGLTLVAHSGAIAE
jgi:hypothetical protein